MYTDSHPYPVHSQVVSTSRNLFYLLQNSECVLNAIKHDSVYAKCQVSHVTKLLVAILTLVTLTMLMLRAQWAWCKRMHTSHPSHLLSVAMSHRFAHHFSSVSGSPGKALVVRPAFATRHNNVWPSNGNKVCPIFFSCSRSGLTVQNHTDLKFV